MRAKTAGCFTVPPCCCPRKTRVAGSRNLTRAVPSGRVFLGAIETLGRMLFGTILVGCALSAGCATPGNPVSAPVRLFDLPANVLSAGAYHGVTLFFEVDLRVDGSTRRLVSPDLPELDAWFAKQRDENLGYRQLPPITPEILPDGREIYRLGRLHRVDYANAMFEVGKYRYLKMDQARLYVFKPRSGFAFRFRGQEVAVPSEKTWIPSIYYFPEEIVEGGQRRTVREVVQVGLSTIELFHAEGRWLVDGKVFYPSGERPLVLRDALRSRGY